MIQRVSIIGWGRLAQHLSVRRGSVGVEIVSAHSRSKANLETDLIPSDVDAYLVAVSDDAIEMVAAILPQGPIRIHHAGSVPLSHMGCSISNSGVIWPPQTFGQIEQTVDWNAVPIAVQSDNAAVVALARALSPIAFEVTETHSPSFRSRTRGESHSRLAGPSLRLLRGRRPPFSSAPPPGAAERRASPRHERPPKRTRSTGRPLGP
jgi:hypothetical protein